MKMFEEATGPAVLRLRVVRRCRRNAEQALDLSHNDHHLRETYRH
jgi:hypothetical protein